jgi:hypothetical protein
VAYALLRAVSRLISTPGCVQLCRGVEKVSDGGTQSACATSESKECEYLPDPQSKPTDSPASADR